MPWLNPQEPYYVGLLSGTSMDSIDVALVDFRESMPQLIATHSHGIPPHLTTLYNEMLHGKGALLKNLGILDHHLGTSFGEAVNHLLHHNAIKKEEVAAIGSHGQTLYHHPKGNPPFTWQIGDPNGIAAKTGIITVADFRRKDMAYGGEGAPLTPAFHKHFFSKKGTARFLLNIGGIANITYLPPSEETVVLGFDTGPGNTLLDQWAQKYIHRPFDHQGQWGATGTIHKPLLTLLLKDHYFHQSPPKSTGREYFNEQWVENTLLTLDQSLSPQDVQATLTELTACTIAHSIKNLKVVSGDIYISGGGVHNHYLVERLKYHCKGYGFHSTEALGFSPDWMEAMAFAWFAKNTLTGQTSNLPSVTGAKKATVLGGIYFP